MANFPTNPSIGDLFETKHDTFKWNGSGWEALGRILTHRQKSGTPYSSLSIKESGGVLDSYTYDANTVLLIGETTEGGVHTIEDQSLTPHSITLNGNAELAKGYSFDGTGDYVTIPGHSDFDFSLGGDFTIECWVKPNASGSYFAGYAGSGADANTVWSMDTNLSFWVGGAGSLTHAAITDRWYHFAVCRSGGTVRLYIDGVEKDSLANPTFRSVGSPVLEIGRRSFISNWTYDGQIHNFRISDTARYTADFTAEITTIDANHKLALDGKTTDSSSSAHSVTFNGNAHEVSKLGGISMKFDGTGDYISVPASTDWNLGSDDFTIECWVRGGSTNQTIAGIWETTASDRSWVFAITSGSAAYFGLSTDGTGTNSLALSGTTDLSGSTWHHLAAVRSGNTVTLYVNGTAEASQVWNYTVHSTTQGLALGAERLLSPRNYLNGYIDELRISTIARYTGAFTPQSVEHDIATFTEGWGSPNIGSTSRGLFVNKDGLVMKSSDGTLTKMDGGSNAVTGTMLLTAGVAPAANSKPTLYTDVAGDLHYRDPSGVATKIN
jgi:hypothetical protein